MKDPSSIPPFFLTLCSLLCELPPLPSPSMLWYADMQEFLGLKMIDQTCQPWLQLLKMAVLTVYALVIGARVEFLTVWLAATCLSTAHVSLARVWLLVCVCTRVTYHLQNACLLITLPLFTSVLHGFVWDHAAVFVSSSSCEWGVCRWATPHPVFLETVKKKKNGSVKTPELQMLIVCLLL